MRVVIVNAFERSNRGDAALLGALIEQVREAWPGAEIRICGFEDPKEFPDFDGVPNLGSLRRYAGELSVPVVVRHARKLLAVSVAAVLGAGLGPALSRVLGRLLPAEPAAEFKALAGADTVISVGGGYLRGGPGIGFDTSVALLLYPLWVAQRFGVPTISAPQSYGPFPTRFQRSVVRRVLPHHAVVSAREDISRDTASAYAVPEAALRRDVDSAFAFTGRSDRDWRGELSISRRDTVVVLTAKRYLAPDRQARYERETAGAVAHILEDEHTHVVLAPQTTSTYHEDDDRIVQGAIAALVGPHPRLIAVEDATTSHHDITALYRTADFMIGTRFHSVIFSLVAQVPCIAVSYERKGRGIMRDLGLERWVIDMGEVTAERLSALYDEMRAESEEYRAVLASVIPAYRERAHEFVDVLRSVTGDAQPVEQAQAEMAALSVENAGRSLPSTRRSPK